MIKYLKRKFESKKQANTFSEFGYDINKFKLDEIGEVEYAQWLHPFEGKKEISDSKVRFYTKLLNKGEMAVDIGAHTGDTTVPMALAAGKEGLVVALEPNRYVYKILEKNSQLNRDHTNIASYCFAATIDNQKYTFNYSDASFCNGGYLSQLKHGRLGHKYLLEVEGINLQNFLYQKYSADLSRLKLIKIDAEGYDKEILKTIPKILREYKPALMVECYKKLLLDERNELYDVLLEYEYELFHLDNFEENDEKIKLVRKDFDNKNHMEILGIHKSKL